MVKDYAKKHWVNLIHCLRYFNDQNQCNLLIQQKSVKTEISQKKTQILCYRTVTHVNFFLKYFTPMRLCSSYLKCFIPPFYVIYSNSANVGWLAGLLDIILEEHMLINS